MKPRFEFATANRILFGSGCLRELGSVCEPFGRRALVVTGSNTSRANRAVEILGNHRLDSIAFPVGGEPELGTVQLGVALAREHHCDMVVGIGGGSALDAAKAIAAMLANPGELLDYLEVIGPGKPLPNPSIPFVAIPTTAGTGTEVTRNAVLASPEHRVKVSLRSPAMLSKVALIDPELTLGLPPELTASTGLDALTQLIEPYVSIRANPLTDSLCVEGIRRVARSLRRAWDQGCDIDAREDMAVASLFGGMALANAGLGAVHGFAAPIGGGFKAPHGAVCAILLPSVMEANLRALRQRAPDSHVVRRFDEIGHWLTGSAKATAEDGVRWVRELILEMKVPRLTAYAVTRNDIPGLVEKAVKASSMKANPIVLSSAELSTILESVL